ncbi:helix-turn-helix domain-containing protein [Actinophytocola sediminis]
MAGKAPTPRDRQVGMRLRELRTSHPKLSLEAAARVAEVSPAMLSRMETGKRHISPEEVAMITTAYRVPVAQRRELIEFVKSGDAGGWWERPLPGVPQEMGLLASYANEATSLTDWSVMLIPGLLQVESYARAVWLADGVSPDDADLRWVARRRRQEIVGRIDYTAFVHERALRIPIGGAEVHREQLEHLVGARDRGVSLRVVERRQRIGGMLSHSWHYMSFPSATPVVNVEVYGGGFYLQDDRAEPYTHRLKRLGDIALSSTASRTIIQAVLKEVP